MRKKLRKIINRSNRNRAHSFQFSRATKTRSNDQK